MNTLLQLDILAFIAVQFCRGVYCCGVPIRSMWSEKYNIAIVSSLMSRNKFVKIMKFLRFDDKETRPERINEDKFAMVRSIWGKFIYNSRYINLFYF